LYSFQTILKFAIFVKWFIHQQVALERIVERHPDFMGAVLAVNLEGQVTCCIPLVVVDATVGFVCGVSLMLIFCIGYRFVSIDIMKIMTFELLCRWLISALLVFINFFLLCLVCCFLPFQKL
jgi:hypothetical protein